MNLLATEDFEHKGNTFQITTSAEGNRFVVVAKLDGVQVSPQYSVDLTTHSDYFMQHKTSLIAHLKDIARSDIQDGMYYKA